MVRVQASTYLAPCLQQPWAVTRGTAPYTFAVSSGQLPNGIALAKDSGTVSGTPSSAGTFNFVVSAVDSKGNSSQKSLQIPVADNSTASSGGSSGGGGSNGGSSNGANASGKSFANLQRTGGWGQYGQGPPHFVDCSPSPCDGISFWMQQGVNNPSKSGSATQFNLGGSAPYSDALWNNHLIGPFSSQGTVDGGRSLVRVRRIRDRDRRTRRGQARAPFAHTRPRSRGESTGRP